jgi:hypothetical protein
MEYASLLERACIRELVPASILLTFLRVFVVADGEKEAQGLRFVGLVSGDDAEVGGGTIFCFVCVTVPDGIPGGTVGVGNSAGVSWLAAVTLEMSASWWRAARWLSLLGGEAGDGRRCRGRR